jgi:Protein of unknown function (DUF2510)
MRSEVEAPQGGEREGDGLVVALALPAVGALIGLVAGFLLLGSLPGRDATGTALVLLVATAAGLAVGVLLSLVIGLWRAYRRRPKPEPAPAPEPKRAREPSPDPEPPQPPPEPPAPEPEPELPPPADRTPGWHPDPEGGPERRYWDGEAWTAHRWRPRRR